MIQTTLKQLAVLTAACLAVGCASTSSINSKKDMAVAAGFKAVKPTQPEQSAVLDKLPADKFTRITHAGKTYYALPDIADGQVYVGSPEQFQSYQEDTQARAAAGEYEQSTSSSTRQTSEDDSNPGLDLLEGWDWSAMDGQTG